MEAMMMQFKDLQIIPFEEITEATNNFHEDNYLGGGGFGKVYKGELSRFMERGLVAFKRLDRQYGQGETEFLKEISTLSQYKHENLIALLGYCIKEREMILVYEYTAHGSLDFHLGSRELTWTQRLKMCLQAAEGLRYLHDPNGAHHKLIHRDIKSGNILLDENWNAKVADVGLSKISPENTNLVTKVTGTPGYTDPEYHETYMLTEHSDVYSFGVTLFEVLCGSLCYEITGENNVRVFVRKWKESYQENKLEEIIFKEPGIGQMDKSSLKLFSGIAYQCLEKSGEKRPTMVEVVSKLKAALQAQERYDVTLKIPLPKEYAEIVRAAVSHPIYSSIEQLKDLLSEGILVNEGKTWLSLNDKGEHHVMVSIEEYLSLDYPNSDYSDRYSSKEKSRFAVGCYKTRLMEFKLRVTAPLFLSPDVTYGLNLVSHASEIDGMKQQYVGVSYKIQGERKISIMHFVDKKEGKQLVAERYQFNSTEESILDLEILLEDFGLSGDFYIEGIEFLPLEKWLCINEKGEHIERISIQSCLNLDDIEARCLKDPSDFDIVNSRFPGGHLQFEFESRGPTLLVAGIEFQPSEEKVQLPVFEEYQHIVDAASQSLFYTSLAELKQILSKGVLINGYKTWFSLNEKGQHCHMISMEDCLIPNDDPTPKYESHFRSRFPAGFYQTNKMGFTTHVKTQLLSPSITYTVNLVHYISSADEQQYVDLKYRLRGEATTSVVYLANRRQDDLLYMAELFQFTSDGSIVDLEIDFEYYSKFFIEGVEGILFQPVEKVEDQLLEDDRVEDMETISDSDTYWEQKIPNDYEEILKLSKVSLKWKTKKELYSILCKGFLLDNGHQWFSVDKNGKKCQMLSARAAVIDDNNSNWESSNESRFGEVLVITAGYKFEIKGEIKPEAVSPETTYAAYLVSKLPQDPSTFEAPIELTYYKPHYRSSFIYLVSPPVTPVIGPKLDENTYNPLNRYKWNAFPQQRTDGWIEVKVWEFQSTSKSVPMNLYFEHPGENNLSGLMIQGIELRTI
ncbi:protein kinase-like domain, Phloem protein 2-like protein [Artemisia annua]|uniref:Protein kinase-like domain, Phloem protein 2-like protein n=1 Tax=Artemisia annua TaxID=35608 RepID=A0A2U1KWE8_ARTAN|nr:protein kinase-like domain, Phloem protein 2-like protein [Artemisia annua]